MGELAKDNGRYATEPELGWHVVNSRRDAHEPLSRFIDYPSCLLMKGEREPLTVILESIDRTTFFFLLTE